MMRLRDFPVSQYSTHAHDAASRQQVFITLETFFLEKSPRDHKNKSQLTLQALEL